MSDVPANAAADASGAMTVLPAMRQVLLLAGLAAAIAVALWLVLWSRGDDWAPLYSQLGERETSQVVDALAAAAVPNRLDGSTGQVMVPREQLREARMRLAAQGLPQSDALGIEMIQKDSPFGTSQFMEGARYQSALETELARTIAKVQGVQGARVHLALPRQTAFVRDEKRTSASVMLQLYAGRRLEEGQVQAIVHLVASSVPELEAGDVTVVDQAGSLLSGTQGDDALAGSSRQREYTRDLEADYQRRIESLLAPLVGAGKVRAGVTAEVDFTQQEVTREDFDPTQQVVRSEQTSMDQRAAGVAGAEGVPGSLSNQPPGTVPLTGPGAPGTATPPNAGAAVGAAPGGAPGSATAGVAAAGAANSNVAQRATRNFEIDRTISHVRNPVGNVRRLSVAVVIDNRVVTGADGKPRTQPVSAAELERYTALVRDVIGFDAQRGDRVQVLNESFQAVEPAAAALPLEPLWSQPATQGYIRQGVAVLLVLLVVAFVLRPVMKGLFPAPPAPGSSSTVLLAHRAAPGEVLLEPVMARQGLPAPANPLAALPSPQHYEQQVANARARVGQDPRRAAQVVKEWVAADG